VAELTAKASKAPPGASSQMDNVYYWLGGNPLAGQTCAVVYNRHTKGGVDAGPECFVHVGYNGWAGGESKKIGMMPLPSNHWAGAYTRPLLSST
jgi:hypothetical protein